MKKFLAAALALAMTMSLVSCGGSGKPGGGASSTGSVGDGGTSTSDSTPSAGGPVEVMWWTYFGDANIGYLQNIIDDFNAGQEKYHVTIEYQGNQLELNAKIQSTVQSELPAMFSGGVEDVSMYANADYCVPLQKFVDQDTQGWPELDHTWEALRSNYSDNHGNLVGYSIGYSYPCIFYNADMLKKAGIAPEELKSFDDLYSVSVKLVSGGHTTYGIGFYPNGAMFNCALSREGIQAYDHNNGMSDERITRCLYVEDQAVYDAIYNMLDVYQRLGAEKLCVPYGSDYQAEIIPQMSSGDCAMMMGVVSMTTKVLSAVDGAFEVGILPMLSATARGKCLGEPAAGTGSYICNNGNAEQMQGAYEFIKFASTADQAAYFATQTGYLAPNQEAYDSQVYQDYVKNTFPGISVAYESLAKSDDSGTNPYIPISNEMRDANKLAIERAATDPNADIKDVIKTAQETIQESIDLYNLSNP